MAGNWEGNRRSVIALAMSHIFQWFIHYEMKAYKLVKKRVDGP